MTKKKEVVAKKELVITSAMKQSIDRLGVIREEIAVREKEEKVLSDSLAKDIPVGTQVYGEFFTAEPYARYQFKLDPELVRKEMRSAVNFIKIISVSKTDAKKFLTDAEIERCVKGEPKKSVVVKTDRVVLAS